MEFKVILVGDNGVGKSVLLKRYKTGEFVSKYIPTMGVDVTLLTFNTNYGSIALKVWDCAGQETFGGLRDGYYKGANGAIIMFDLSSRQTFMNASNWLNDFLRATDDTSVVICGNKADIKDRKVPWSEIRAVFPMTKFDYFDISAKSNYNFENPFLGLLQKLTGHHDLVLVDMPPVTPPEIVVLPPDISSKTQTEPKSMASLSLPLPLPHFKFVNFMKFPDGSVTKVTHEYYPDDEILNHESS